VLQLQLVAEGRLIGFYRLDTGEKLLVPAELAAALQQETQARQQAETRAAELEAKLAQYRKKFGDLPES
jgi:hypothetical protein